MRGLLIGLVALAGLGFAGTAGAGEVFVAVRDRGHYVAGRYDCHHWHHHCHPAPVYVPYVSGYYRERVIVERPIIVEPGVRVAIPIRHCN
jgi:hypothetical protein